MAIRFGSVRCFQISLTTQQNTRGCGAIDVTVTRDGDCAVVSVKDTGVGIPPEMLTRVFDIFTQVDHSLGRAQGGIGVGLSLTRSLVRLHGGTIDAQVAARIRAASSSFGFR